jgi:hypothetical protein
MIAPIDRAGTHAMTKPMFILHLGCYPAIMCPETLETIIVFNNDAAGFGKCIKLIQEVQADMAEETCAQ